MLSQEEIDALVKQLATPESESGGLEGKKIKSFDFRYNNREKLGVDDAQRAARAVQNAKGRRLTYERLG